MPYPQAAGTPNYAGITIPEIWSGRLLVKYWDASVLTSISNTNYEDEIRDKGDTVHIRTEVDVTIRDHTDGQELVYEHLVPDVVDLVIDKGKYGRKGWYLH
jgi:hypothetical protein